LKSSGDFGKTVCPRTKNLDLSKQKLISALTTNGKDYEKGGFILEERIDGFEYVPEIAFWDGKPIYSAIDFEVKDIAAGVYKGSVCQRNWKKSRLYRWWGTRGFWARETTRDDIP